MNVLLRAANSAFALLLTRAEFASVELSLARERLLGWLLAALAAGVLAVLGLIALSATIVIALWDRFGWYTAAALAILYGGATALLVGRLLHALATAPPLLAQTFAELAKDRDALRGGFVRRSDEDRAP
jgi:uncharacterized membrane protein YqjE